MAKFLDKKERVVDFKLTPYGKHKLAVGKFKPTYYSFFDNGVVYDSKYASFSEPQSATHDRIKNKTQYIEGILSFEELENTIPGSSLSKEALEYTVGDLLSMGFTYEDMYSGTGMSDTYTVLSAGDGEVDYLSATGAGLGLVPGGGAPATGGTGAAAAAGVGEEADVDGAFMMMLDSYGVSMSTLVAKDPSVYKTSMFDMDIEGYSRGSDTMYVSTPDIFQFDSSIGDAMFDGKNTQHAPAWKVVTCQGEITKSQPRDDTIYTTDTSVHFEDEKEYNIPQLEVDLYYTKVVGPPQSRLMADEIPVAINQTLPFIDGNVIRLENNDLIVYADEINTELLTENFDIEVFCMNQDAGMQKPSVASILLNHTKSVSVGDTITIDDGEQVKVFEFIDDAGGAPTGTNVGVVISSNYKELGIVRTRFGTMYNLISAIMGLSGGGNKDNGFPTKPNYGTNSDGDYYSHSSGWHGGRCKKASWPYQTSGVKRCWHSTEATPQFRTLELGPESLKDGGEESSVSLKIDMLLTSGKTTKITSVLSDSSVLTIKGFHNGGVKKITQLQRKFFHESTEQIVDGIMKYSNPVTKTEEVSTEVGKNTVEYYFDVATDAEMDKSLACQCASAFNKNSFYVDIDFECDKEEIMPEYYDIYGAVTVPEICIEDDEEISQGEICEDVEN